LNVIDSSAWIEYFTDGPNTPEFQEPIERFDELVVPSITLYEVFKHIAQRSDEHKAFRAVIVMQQGRVVDLDASLAISAANLSRTRGLPLADSIILATARRERATLWTQDRHFEGLPGVEYRAKETPA